MRFLYDRFVEAVLVGLIWATIGTPLAGAVVPVVAGFTLGRVERRWPDATRRLIGDWEKYPIWRQQTFVDALKVSGDV